MEDFERPNDVPYIVYESSMARSERHIRRLVIALIIAIVMIAITNVAWILMWNSYEYVGDSVSYEQDGEGLNIIGDRNILNEPESDTENSIPQEEKR